MTLGLGDAHHSSRWSARAAGYDAWFDRPWGRHATEIEHQLLVSAIEPMAGLTVLDAGCGTGRFTRRLEASGAHVIGIDRDPEALSLARGRVTGPLVIGDVHGLPLRERCVDIAVAMTVCEFADDPAAVIAELVRVTRPGGVVVIGSLNPRSAWGWWSRRTLHQPPWDRALFLDRHTLTRLGGRHGSTELRAGLYSPTALPLQRWWAPVVEWLGARIASGLGAFQVLTIRLPEPEREP